jgi:hypothetical protein
MGRGGHPDLGPGEDVVARPAKDPRALGAVTGLLRFESPHQLVEEHRHADRKLLARGRALGRIATCTILLVRRRQFQNLDLSRLKEAQEPPAVASSALPRPPRCVHIAGRVSDTSELFDTNEEFWTRFLVIGSKKCLRKRKPRHFSSCMECRRG